jgi:DNA-binding NarL/FixJ family response regulator
MENIRLFIVEDQLAILKCQVSLLSACPQIEIVGTAMSGEEALENILALSQPPHVILCDIGLPKMSGIDVTRAIKDFNHHIEILIFTVFEEDQKVLEAIKAGACGYLLKGEPTQKIYEAIIEVHQGGTIIQPSLARRLLKYFAMPLSGIPEALEAQENLKPGRETDANNTLTVRELECLQIIAKGLSNHEAAKVLKISKATIRTHLEHIYQKLDVTNRVEAVTEGIRQGIIDL